MCTLQFRLLLMFLGISCSVIFGGLYACYESFLAVVTSPVLFHEADQYRPVPKVIWKLWCITLSHVQTRNFEVQERSKAGDICVTQAGW